MAQRPVWKGQIRLSLVSIPVEVYAATKPSAHISFRQIHGPSGKPVQYEKVVAGVGPVKQADILKGYETAKGDYLLLDPKEVESMRIETKKTLDLVQFVEQCEIPPLYFDTPYYVVPSDDLAEEAYRVLRDALRAEKKAGIGQLVMRGRENLCAIRPCGDGILLETLRYEDEIREAEPLFHSIEDKGSDKDLVAVATQLITAKTAPFDAGAFKDHYEQALRELIETKRKNRATPRASVSAEEERPAGGNVVDLMAALKASLKADQGAKKKPAKKSG